MPGEVLAIENYPLTLRVAIVCYRPSIRDVEQALGSLAAAIARLRTVAPDREVCRTKIILIDNSEDSILSLDQVVEFRDTLEELNTGLTLIQGHGNIGYGSAQNLALQNSDESFHVFMNPDVIVSEDALHRGIAYLEQNPDVAVASPSATNADGVKQYLCKGYPTVFALFLRGFTPSFIKSLFRKTLDRYELRSLPEDRPSSDIQIVSGCFMLGRTSAFKEVGGFDESYFLYFEDFDLSMRLHQNYKLAYLPNMKIIHHGGNAGRKGLRHIIMFTRSATRFFNSHGWRWLLP